MKLIILLIISLYQIQCNYCLSPYKASLLLAQYGYMDIPHNIVEQPNALMMYGDYREAIKKLQRLYKLPVTGLLTPKVKKLLTAKRCGNPDLNIQNDRFKVPFAINSSTLDRNKRFVIDDPRFRWHVTDLTWRIKSYPRYFSSSEHVRAVFTKAFNFWSVNSGMNFREELNTTKKVDIVIVFGARKHGDSIPFDGPGGTLAHAFYPTGVKGHTYTSSGDTHFDDSETWVAHGNPDGVSLLAVATHEIGHSLGIGHSGVEDAVMFPYYYNDGSVEFDLHPDDIKAVQYLYKKPKPNKRPASLPHVPHTIPKFTRATTTTTTTRPPHYVEFCNTTIDTILSIRKSEMYLFKGLDHWRLSFTKSANGWVNYEVSDGPFSMFTYWITLPRSLTHVDGAIEKSDQKIYIFSGSRFWLLINSRDFHPLCDRENGLPLTELGLPPLDKIDAVFRWGYNKAIYIFAGYKYWKFNENEGDFGRIYERYPREIDRNWHGLPPKVDTAFTDVHGITYFIKGKYYYQFDNLLMDVSGGRRPLRVPWLGCFDSL